MGEAFAGIRDKVVIATKCGITDTGERNFSIPYVTRCIEGSLEKLKTDYIDIFQLTKPTVAQVTDELLSFFERKIKDGTVRHFGISVVGVQDGRIYLAKKEVESLQIFYNLLFIESHDLIKDCAGKNKFVIIRSPLNSGILSGRYTLKTKFENVDIRNRIFKGPLLKERLECVEKMKSRFGLTSEELLEFSLNFIFSNDSVNVVIPAASNLEQLKRYIEIFNENKRFSKTEIIEIVDFIQNKVSIKDAGQLI